MRLYRLYRRDPLLGICLFRVDGDDLHVERVVNEDALLDDLRRRGEHDERLARLRVAVASGHYLISLDDDLDPFLREADVVDPDALLGTTGA